jgi:hypothetical protein
LKQCPQCNRRYADDSLNFCLDDGAVLARVSDSQSSRDSDATLVYGSADSGRSAPTAYSVAPNLAPTVRAAPTVPLHLQQTAQSYGVHSKPSNRLFIGGVLAVGLLLLLSVGIGAAFLFRQSRLSSEAGTNLANVGPAESASSPSSREGATEARPLANNPTSEDGQSLKSAPLKIKATASSVRYAVQSNTYDPANAIDGSKATAWIEGREGPGWGEWLRFDFDREINLHRILILPGYFKSPAIWKSNNRISGATIYFSDGSSRLFNFPDSMERQTLDLGSIRTRWVRIELEDFYFGNDPDTAISEVAFEWEP